MDPPILPLFFTKEVHVYLVPVGTSNCNELVRHPKLKVAFLSCLSLNIILEALIILK